MAKNKNPLIEEVISALPSYSHEEILTLKEAIRQEWADRLQKSENDANLLKNGK